MRHKKMVSMLSLVWFAATLMGATFFTACVDEHHHDHDRVAIVDDHGYRHEGYYDEHHDWHGGYYDEHHDFHDDPGDWHH